MPATLQLRGIGYFARRAAVALRRIGEFQSAFDVSEAALIYITKHRPKSLSCSQILDLANTAGEQNRLALESRLLRLARKLLGLYNRSDDQFSIGLTSLRQCARLGYWDEAEEHFLVLNQEEDADKRSILYHHYAMYLFFRGQLSEEYLARAESLNRVTNSALGVRNLGLLRGSWHLERGEWELAKESLTRAVSLARRIGKIDRMAEIRLALANFHLNDSQNIDDVLTELSVDVRPNHRRDLAMLCAAFGNVEQAEVHAHIAFRWATGDGEPFVLRSELTKSQRLFDSLGITVPAVHSYIETDEQKLPLEAEVSELIDRMFVERDAEASDERES